jgi:hypothetical protein
MRPVCEGGGQRDCSAQGRREARDGRWRRDGGDTREEGGKMIMPGLVFKDGHTLK